MDHLTETENNIENTFMSLIRDEIDRILNKMTDKQRIKLIKYCHKMTPSNCSWVDYGLRKIIEKEIKINHILFFKK